MAKTPTATLITDLAKRLDLDSTDATVRVDVLRRLNVSQREICQDFSLRFLATQSTLAVVASSVAVPATIDPSKAMSLGRAGGDGEIEYVSPDEWYRIGVDTYGNSTISEPTHYTVVDVSGTLTFLFKPAALSATVPYIAQKIVVDMADGGQTTALPEMWEDTLLLDHAEMEWKRIEHEDGWRDLEPRVNDKKERLYSSYRTTKEQPMTDREQEQRKVAKEKLRDEA
jgi:hypothetical protein